MKRRPPGGASRWSTQRRGLRSRHLRLEGEALSGAVDEDRIAGFELAVDDAAGERVLDVAPDRARQRAGAELGVVAHVRDELPGRGGHLDGDPLALEVLVQAPEHYVHYLDHVVLDEGVEDDDLVDPVEELGAEGPLQRLPRAPLGLAEIDALLRGEAELPVGDEVLAAHVGGHDDDRVLEVDRPALRVGEPAVVQDLEHRVEDVRVGLLYLVEEDDRVGPAPDLLGELAGLLVADVARRGPDEARDGVALLELAHVHPDHRVLLTEEVLGKGTRELGLADPCGSEEDKAPDRALRVLYAGPGAPDRLGDGLDGLLLADDALVQDGLEVQEPLGLLLDDAGRGDAGPLFEDARDVLARHLGGLRLAAPGPALLLLAQLGIQLRYPLLQRGRGLVVLGAHGVVLLALEGGYLLLDPLDVHGRHRGAEPDLRGRLVEQVYGLVRQEAVGYVAVAELRGRDERLLGDFDPVVRLVAVPQAEEDRHGLVHRRLVHQDRLEAALKGRVLLDVLAVLVERGGPHDLELAARQRRLEHVRGVDRPLGPAGPDEGVQLVYKEDDVLLLILQLLEHLLYPLLEVPAEAGAGDEAADVEGEHALLLQGLGDVLGDDAQCQTLGYGRLAYPRLTDQNRVVLGAPGQYADDPRDLLGPPDDGIEPALPRELGKIPAHLVEDRRPALRPLRTAGHPRTARRGPGRPRPHPCAALLQEAQDLAPESLGVAGPVLLQYPVGVAVALAEQPEQQMLAADLR